MKLDARIERPNISRFMLPIRALKYTPPPPMLFLVHPFVGLVTPLPLTHSAPSLCTGLIHLFIHPSNIYRVLPRVAPRPGDTDEQCAVLASGQSPPPPGSTGAAWPPHASAQSGAAEARRPSQQVSAAAGGWRTARPEVSARYNGMHPSSHPGRCRLGNREPGTEGRGARRTAGLAVPRSRRSPGCRRPPRSPGRPQGRGRNDDPWARVSGAVPPGGQLGETVGLDLG